MTNAGVKWTQDSIPDLTGNTIIITGANSGTGFAAAKAMAAKGATIVMACRNPAKANAAIESIRSEIPEAKLEYLPLDLADLSSVRQFSDEFKGRYASLDILLNNAGMCQIPEQKTKDGFEMQFGVNHLGHFALTAQLMDRLIETELSRVVTMSSVVHAQGEIRFDNLFRESEYRPAQAYQQSKLANLLFAYELNRRLGRAGVSVESLAAHPGFSRSNILKTSDYAKRSVGFSLGFGFFNAILAMPSSKGALGMMRAGVDQSLSGGDYVGPKSMGGLKGYPIVLKSSDSSYSEADAEKLWTISEELTGLKFEIAKVN